MAGPSATDQQLAERIDGLSRTLADFRVEVSERFGKLEADLAGFRSAVQTELGIVRKLGAWLLSGVFGAVVALIGGAATVGYSASAMVSKAEQQGARLDKLESRLDGIEKKLDTLLDRGEPKAGG